MDPKQVGMKSKQVGEVAKATKDIASANRGQRRGRTTKNDMLADGNKGSAMTGSGGMEIRVGCKCGVRRDGKNRPREKLYRMKTQQIGYDRLQVRHKE